MADISEFRINETSNSINRTAGEFTDEKESDAAFNRLAEDCGCFSIYRQKRGEIHYLPHWREKRSHYKPDFILLPTTKLISCGWSESMAIVVDAKRSNEQIGPGCNQLWDYLCASYQCGERIIRPTWAFLWPARKQEKCTASLMAHQHFGTVIHGGIRESGVPKGLLHFYCGESLILSIGETIKIGDIGIGKRSGSR